MHCKMCGKKGSLIKAHIFPRSLREFAFEGNKNFKTVEIPSGKVVDSQDIEFDTNLFCRECDEIMSPYEKELKYFRGCTR